MIVGIIVIAASILCFFGTKERVKNMEKQSEGEKEEKSVPARKAVKSLFQNKYWVLMTVCMFLIFFVIVMYAVAAAYYAQYVLGDIGFYETLNLSE